MRNLLIVCIHCHLLHSIVSGSSALLCSAAKKKQKERDKFRSTTRVILEEQKVRWDRLKADLNPKSDHKVAEVLLEFTFFNLSSRRQ